VISSDDKPMQQLLGRLIPQSWRGTAFDEGATR
jgi:hypothetical protein